MSNNIIDSIQLSGTVYTIQGTGGGGSPTVELTQAEYDALVSAGTVAQDTYYIITDAPEVNPNDYVKKVSNIASGYTDVITPKSSYSYSEAFNDTVYWNASNYTYDTTSNIGYVNVYTDSTSSSRVDFSVSISNKQITATTSSSPYLTIEIVNGELAVTPNEGYYYQYLWCSDNASVNSKHHYSSGQSRNVIENTIYDVLDKRNEQINTIDNKIITSVTTSINSDGYLYTSSYTKRGNSGIQGTKITSSTINNDNGLNVQFSSSTATQKVLNTGSGNYCALFNNGNYNISFDDISILFNENYHGNTQTFRIRFINTSNNYSNNYSFTYNPKTTSITWDTSGIETYATVTDTVSTDYKLKFVANEGYRISYFNSNNCNIGGVDNTRPYNYCTNLITTTSYIHNGQDIIDDLYANKQDTLSAGTGISIVDNVISAEGGGTIDQSVISGSTNAVSGGAVYTQLGGLKLQKITQSAYDALATKDANTLYVING